MNILISINSIYIEPAKMMLSSVRKYNSGEITVYLLNYQLSEEEIKEFKAYLKEKKDIELVEINMNIAAIEALPVIEPFSIEMYYRIVAQCVLPDTVDRVLWLDSDIIVTGDISEFYNSDFGDKYMVVCSDAKPCEDLKQNMGIAKDHIYFNSGVLLLNIEKLRSYMTLDELCNECLKMKNRLKYPDQDLLNYLYQGSVKYEDNTIYNFQMHLMKNEDRKKAKIIHYTGKEKPWMVGSMQNIHSEYWKIKKENGDTKGYILFTISTVVFNIQTKASMFCKRIYGKIHRKVIRGAKS